MTQPKALREASECPTCRGKPFGPYLCPRCRGTGRAALEAKGAPEPTDAQILACWSRAAGQIRSGMTAERIAFARELLAKYGAAPAAIGAADGQDSAEAFLSDLMSHCKDGRDDVPEQFRERLRHLRPFAQWRQAAIGAEPPLTYAQADRIVGALDPSDGGHDEIAKFIYSLAAPHAAIGAEPTEVPGVDYGESKRWMVAAPAPIGVLAGSSSMARLTGVAGPSVFDPVRAEEELSGHQAQAVASSPEAEAGNRLLGMAVKFAYLERIGQNSDKQWLKMQAAAIAIDEALADRR